MIFMTVCVFDDSIDVIFQTDIIIADDFGAIEILMQYSFDYF